MGLFVELNWDKYTKGKSVCIIGAASSLLDNEQAEAINSYDIVARVNWGWPISDKVASYTGSRCDVLYMGDGTLTGWLKNPEYFNRADMDWIVAVRCTVGGEKHLAFTKQLNGVAFRITGRPYEKIIKRIIGTLPNSGHLAITDLLSTGLRELYVTGFDFYSSGVYEGYGSNDKSRPTVPNGVGPRHDQRKHLAAFRRLCELDKRIKVDGTLRGML